MLRHEMAHQFAHEVLGATDEVAHGPAFRAACARLGVDPVAAGLAPLTGQGGEPRAVRRIRKLLALAASENRHEAEAAMARAQALMVRHNIDDAAPRAYTARVIGPSKARFHRWEKTLARLLADHFFVRVLWIPTYLRDRGREGRAAEFMGAPENLDMAEYVHAFLSRTVDTLWGRARADGVTGGRGARQQFALGVIRGVNATLLAGRARLRREGLVWVADPALTDWVERRYPRINKGRGGTFQASAAYLAGAAAGRDVVIHRPISDASSRGRLLTDGG